MEKAGGNLVKGGLFCTWCAKVGWRGLLPRSHLGFTEDGSLLGDVDERLALQGSGEVREVAHICRGLEWEI